MSIISSMLEPIMNGCYSILGNYGCAIILFTLISKIILLPITLWTYFNSVKMIRIQPEINELKAKFYGQPDVIADEQSLLFRREKYNPFLSVLPLVLQLVLLMAVIDVIRSGIANPAIDMHFLGLNLGAIPHSTGLSLIWSPILAGLSSLALCLVQNHSNVLQSEQNAFNRYGTLLFSVILSLYLGWFVPLGTCLYWICSNVFAVLQLFITNAVVHPKRFIDYDRLDKSRELLAELRNAGSKKRETYFSENRKRERTDYKRFFSIINKHLVFYSESNGFYKYYRGLIEYILAHSKLNIHYITSDPNDQVFALSKSIPQLHAYYIGENKLITLMMKMDADVVCMTMPDLETYHIKRSYIRNDIEYIFIPHGMGSDNMGMRKGAKDHFDTVFCSGPFQKLESERAEEVWNTKKKNNFEFGYPLLDEMLQEYKKPIPHMRRRVLIAPSWQKDNLIELCLEPLLESLKSCDVDIIVRPHPQQVRHKGDWLKKLSEKYIKDNIFFELDFTSGSSILNADLMITDWSGITWEYCFTTLHPVIFINTPMKIMNPQYQELGIIPVNILMRERVGKSINPEQIDQIGILVLDLLSHSKEWEDRIRIIRDEMVYHLGFSSQVGGEYILQQIRNKVKNKNLSN